MNNKGFSFIELLVVMAILAILMGVGIQSFGLVKHGNIRKSNEFIYEDLQETQKNSKNIYADLYWQMNIKNEDGIYTIEIVRMNVKEVAELAGGMKKVPDAIVVDSRKLVENVNVAFNCGAYSNKTIEDGKMLSVTFHGGTGEVDRLEYDDITNAYQDESNSSTAKMNDVYTKSDALEQVDISVTQKGTNYKKGVTLYFNTGKVVNNE